MLSLERAKMFLMKFLTDKYKNSKLYKQKVKI